MSKVKRLAGILIMMIVSFAAIFLIQRLVMPKYTGKVAEGSFTAEYYTQSEGHDVLILGDCEVYENISPVTLWENFGISSYIRGNAQQLIPQSYYLLEDTLKYEVPKAVVLSISAMQQIEQISEPYNRMTLDEMRWSKTKWDAIQNTKLPEEYMIEYLLPILRYHSRFAELESDDFAYFYKPVCNTYSGYYLRADVRPVGEFPSERRRGDYSFDEKGWDYLERIRCLCADNGIELILMKAPSLYPVWYDEWDAQIMSYAEEHGLVYVNCIELADEIGIDFNTDTYDGGLHMNVYGAEKMSMYFGNILKETEGISDRRGESTELDRRWSEIAAAYEFEKNAQEQEFAEKGFLSRYN